MRYFALTGYSNFSVIQLIEEATNVLGGTYSPEGIILNATPKVTQVNLSNKKVALETINAKIEGGKGSPEDTVKRTQLFNELALMLEELADQTNELWKGNYDNITALGFRASNGAKGPAIVVEKAVILKFLRLGLGLWKIMVARNPGARMFFWTAVPLAPATGPTLSGYSTDATNIRMPGLVEGGKYTITVVAAGKGNNNAADASLPQILTAY